MRIGPRPALLALASLPVLLTLVPPAGRTADAPAPPFIKPFPGAQETDRSTRPFDGYWMPLGRLSGEAQAARVQSLDGRWTHSAFLTPAGRTVTEVMRHYEQQIADAGLEVVYACKGTECGEGGRRSNGDWWPLSEHRQFLVARLVRPTGDLWVSMHVHARLATAPVIQELDMIEAKPPPVPPPPRNEADVATLEQELKSEGRVVLHTLEFVDRRPAVLPASQPVIGAIADLLARDPALRLYVVVHDDDSAPAAASLDLTKKRATAVVSTLTRQYHIPGGRLLAAGVGAFAPIASNRTEEGRAVNRRVELVVQGAGRSGVAAAGVRR